jgi:hypothetical protein
VAEDSDSDSEVDQMAVKASADSIDSNSNAQSKDQRLLQQRTFGEMLDSFSESSSEGHVQAKDRGCRDRYLDKRHAEILARAERLREAEDLETGEAVSCESLEVPLGSICTPPQGPQLAASSLSRTFDTEDSSVSDEANAPCCVKSVPEAQLPTMLPAGAVADTAKPSADEPPLEAYAGEPRIPVMLARGADGGHLALSPRPEPGSGFVTPINAGPKVYRQLSIHVREGALPPPESSGSGRGFRCVVLEVEEEDTLLRVLEKLKSRLKQDFDLMAYQFERFEVGSEVSHPMAINATVKDVGGWELMLVDTNSQSFGLPGRVMPRAGTWDSAEDTRNGPYLVNVLLLDGKASRLGGQSPKREGFDCRISISSDQMFLLHHPAPGVGGSFPTTSGCALRYTSSSNVSEGRAPRPSISGAFRKIGALFTASDREGRAQPEALVFADRRFSELESVTESQRDRYRFSIQWATGVDAPAANLAYLCQTPEQAKDLLNHLRGLQATSRERTSTFSSSHIPNVK